jgi:cellulose synthase/poly-beta-1,6-N-acetylglucosamine synthase-like glycosyltransferase
VTSMLALGVLLLVFSGAVLLIGWVLYPRLVLLSAGSASRDPSRSFIDPKCSSLAEQISVVIATRDSPELICARVENVRSNGYPNHLLDIVIAVDRSAAFPLETYSEKLGTRARVVRGDAVGGKACALNAGVRAAQSPVVVFADSAPHFRPGAIAALVAKLAAEPELGAVTGTLDPMGGSVGGDAVLRRLWLAELALRRAHAKLHGVCVVTGCVYAIRRAHWRPLPAGAICDDLFVPMAIIDAGLRVGVSDDAIAFDSRAFSRAQEFQRKVRTLTGMLQFVKHRPRVLSPWHNPVWSQFVFHKLMRIATPFLVLTGGIGAALMVASQPLRGLFVWGLLGLMLLAVIAALLAPVRARRVLSNTTWALMLLFAPCVAVWNAVRGRWDVWRPHTSAASRG